MSRTTSSDRERGFTLAGVLVIMTVIAIFVAYTVPHRWSVAVQRDRERQTIFIMKQYARAIQAWQTAHNGLPVTLDQLKEARSPRLVRGPKAEWVDPLTGKVDWILIPPQVAAQGTPTNPNNPNNPNAPGPNNIPRSPWERLQNQNPQPGPGGPSGATGAQDSGTATGQKINSPKDYKGPFVGVRPNITGKSYITLNGADNYEDWLYTINDLQADIKNYDQGLAQMSQWK